MQKVRNLVDSYSLPPQPNSSVIWIASTEASYCAKSSHFHYNYLLKFVIVIGVQGLGPSSSRKKNLGLSIFNSALPQLHNATSAKAAMRAALCVPAPSSALLKYLKSQSEAACFYGPNSQRGFAARHSSSRSSLLGNRSINCPSRISSRCLSTAIARSATAKTGPLNLSQNRLATSKIHTSTGQCRSIPKNKPLGGGGVVRGQRGRSTWSKPRIWLHKLWWAGRNRYNGGKGLRPDDLARGREDGSETSVFSLGRVVSAKAAAQPKLRCTELDEYGNVTLASGEFKKSELIAKVWEFSIPFIRRNTNRD